VIVIADVSGKGIPAALVMTMLRSTIHAEARYEKTARGLLCSVNEIMVKDLDERSFITASCLVINPEGTHMTYARAGHPPLLVQHLNNGGPQALSPRGLALGLTDGNTFSTCLEEMNVPLTSGDAFVLYTDGLTEAMNPEHLMYGTARLQALLGREKSGMPDVLVRHILEDVRDFTQNEPTHDDLTMLVLEVKD
jgi:sigma-B regulation protein RsbU (phosphoserine phosphatase)